MTTDLTQLSCLVLASDPGHHQLVSTWLGATGLVGSVTAVVDHESLCAQMNGMARHLCIVVVDERQRTLPSCLWDYESTKVLVITTSRKTGKQSTWLNRGATDVVSLKKPAVARHVISRLAQDCMQLMQREYFERRTAELKQEVATLKHFMQSNKGAGIPHASALVDASVFAETGSLQPSNDEFSTDATLAMPKHARHLITDASIDSATGLPARNAAITRFQQELDTQQLNKESSSGENAAMRCTVMLLQFVNVANNQPGSSVDQNLQDLILCRAAGMLQSHLQWHRLLGRIDRESLLVLFKYDASWTSRHAANWIRERIGTLDGLIEAERNVRIYTMNLAVQRRLTANDVVDRLEAHAARQKRKAPNTAIPT